MTKNKWSCLTAALSAPVNSEQTDNEQKENNRWINRSKNSTVEHSCCRAKIFFFQLNIMYFCILLTRVKKTKTNCYIGGKKIREIENLFFFMSAPWGGKNTSWWETKWKAWQTDRQKDKLMGPGTLVNQGESERGKKD